MNIFLGPEVRIYFQECAGVYFKNELMEIYVFIPRCKVNNKRGRVKMEGLLVIIQITSKKQILQTLKFKGPVLLDISNLILSMLIPSRKVNVKHVTDS